MKKHLYYKGSFKGNFMATVMRAQFVERKKMELTHEVSGTTLITDAPRDNNGDASSFSPTDLTASSLLACMMTIIAIKAEQKGISLEGMNGSVEKHMATEPRRISELKISLEFPSHLDASERRLFEAVAKSCPVLHSLHPEIKVDCQFL